MKDSDGPARFPLIDVESGQALPSPPLKSTIDPDAEALLRVQDLTTRYDVQGGFLRRVTGRVHAVEKVSFDIARGETLALVGESGCGKSSVGRTILRLTEASGGSVRLGGKELLGLSKIELRALRRRMQIVFQDPFASLDPRMRIGASIAEPMLAHGFAGKAQAREEVAELLRRVGLEPDMARRFPAEFSGGQRQRICIARALGTKPDLIVADEAVSALDVSIKAQVINLMLELQELFGLSYLFISHDMAVVERMSHRIGVMHLGEIVEIGPRRAIFGNPTHPYTRRLLSAIPIPDPARRAIRRGLDNEELKTPIRPVDYRPPQRDYIEVSPGHWVQAAGPEWQDRAA